MYRTVAAGASLFVIYLYQNLLHTCNGQLADDNHDGRFQIVHSARRGIEGTLNEGLTDNDRLSCYLRIPAKSQPLDVKQIKNNGQKDFQVTWDDNSLTGNVQCLLEEDGKVIQKSNKLLLRSTRFFAVIRLNRNLTLQESQDIKYIKHFKDLQKLSAEPFVYHVQINVILLNAETDNSQLNIMRSNIKEYIDSISIKMNIMSTRYCPPVPELNITVDDYHPGKVYTFGDNKLTCEGGFYKGVFWNENQIQESLWRLRLLEFQNSTFNTIDDVRNFSAALNANEFVHERELDVLADHFNQLQTSNVLSDMDSRKNTSNELIANSESKLIKMPLTSNVAEAVRENFAARVENISETQSTGIMFVDSDEKNVNQAFQNIVTLNKSTPIADFFTPNTR
jgi:hypothetical protein